MFKQYYDTDYDIYDDGRCFSHKTNRFLKPQLTNKYPTYNLTINGKKKKTNIHRMVAEMFIPKPEGKNIVNHIDGDTHNFNKNNLEWVNYSENTIHAINTGLTPKGNQQLIKYNGNLPNEEWKPIKDFPLYQVSSCGRVMNIRTKRLLKQTQKTPYRQVQLWKQNKGTTKQIHQLVYTTFADDYDLTGFVINHKDGNKYNNNFSNLEKITYQENNLHAEYTINTHNCSKAVYQLNNDKQVIAEFVSIKNAENTLGILNISRAARTGTRAGGYYWKFKE